MEGREKTPTEARDTEGSTPKKKNGRKEETSAEKRIHICISKGKQGKNVAKTEKRLRKNVYVESKFLPIQGKGRPRVQD